MTNIVTYDVVANIGNSVIQHGIYNNRIYLMKLSRDNFPDIINKLNDIALENGYSKIFAKVPSFARDKFLEHGYVTEAIIPKFHNGYDSIYFMGKYFNESRRIDNKMKDIQKILDISKSKENILEKATTELSLPKGFKYEICNESHICHMADLYRQVFDTYPFPIYDPEYIRKTMNENFVYFSIQKNNRIVALSSSEMDMNMQHVEMTDFATLPDYQGKGFALYLLYKMENEMRQRDIKVAYTISRALSHGINVIFSKMGYDHCGTLINNTNISTIGIRSVPSDNDNDNDNFESMNVWHKFL